jgi:hypothetical protein
MIDRERYWDDEFWLPEDDELDMNDYYPHETDWDDEEFSEWDFTNEHLEEVYYEVD